MVMAPKKESGSEGIKKESHEEQLFPIEWATSGTTGRVTHRDQTHAAAERLMSIMASPHRSPSPAGSSEVGDSSFSPTSATRTQQLGAPPGSESVEGRRTRGEGQQTTVPSANSPLPPGLPLGDVSLTRIKREGSSDRLTERFIGQAEAEFQLLDEEFTPMWWQEEETGGQLKRVWAGKEGEQWMVYVYNEGAALVTSHRLKKGRVNAMRELKERQRGGEAIIFPPMYDLLKDGIYEYLTTYRRETGKCPSATTWKQVWKGSVDSGGRMLTVTFDCTLCRILRKVNILSVHEVQNLKQNGICLCSALVGAKCGQASRKVFEMAPREREGSVASTEEDKEMKKTSSVEGLGFSAEAKQFYKAQGKNLQPPCYRGESSEVDLFAWKRGIERYFETYGIVIDRERVTVAADTLDGEAAKWWNGLWMAERDITVKTWEDLLERLRERFLPPEGEMQIVGKWRRLHQIGSVASYADYVFRLKALCDMGQPAEFKLVFYGLQPELQAEVRRHLRQNKVSTLDLEKLFAVALDAEVGLVRRGGKKEGNERETKGKVEKVHGVEAEKSKPSKVNYDNWGSGSNKGGGWKSNAEDKESNGWKINWGWKTNGMKQNDSKGQGWSKNNQSKERRNGGWGYDEEENTKRDWKDSSEPRKCYICDRPGHSWMYCRDRKSGNGCLRCGSSGHRLINCPQRPEGRGKETDQSTKDDSDLLAYRMELKVMDIEGAPEGSCLLYYPVRVRSYATKALLDSGASVNCIDEDVVNKVGGYLQKKPEGVLLYPDRRKAKVRGVTQLEIRGKGYRENVSFWVVSGLGVPVLLGAPWLRSWNPTINWQTRTLTFSDGNTWKMACKEEDKVDHGKKVKISREEKFHAVGLDLATCLERQEEEEEEEEMDKNEVGNAEELPEWLQEYEDVFEEPVGIDREGRVKHVIRLKEGGGSLQQEAI